MPRSEAFSTLHWRKNDILSFFEFLQKKVSRLNKQANTKFCIISRVVSCKNHVAKLLDSLNKCRRFILSSWESFFCRNLKKDCMSFLGLGNVETATLPGIQGLSCSKVQGFEGVFILKTFQGIHFLFSGSLSWSI